MWKMQSAVVDSGHFRKESKRKEKNITHAVRKHCIFLILDAPVTPNIQTTELDILEELEDTIYH